MEEIVISAISNKIVLSRSNFNLFHKRVMAVILDTISPRILAELNKHDSNSNDFLKLTSTGLEKSYQLGAFDMSTISYKASDICRADQYGELREALSQLRKKDFIMTTEDTDYESSLILKFKFDRRAEYLTVGIDEELYKIIFDLTAGYTLYQTKVLLSFSSIYGMRMYEILAKWRNRKTFYVDLSELRRLTDTLDKYSDTNDFKKRVLDVAKEQLDDSEITDLKFDYKEKKRGRKIIGFDFFIYKTDKAHDAPRKKLEAPSLRWDFSEDMIINFKRFGLFGLKGKNLETVKALKTLLGEVKLAAEIERIHTVATEKNNPIGYLIASLQKVLADNTPDPEKMDVRERKNHAESYRKNEPLSIADILKKSI